MVETLRREKEGRKGNRRGERERKRGVRGKREREIEREGDRERGGKREREETAELELSCKSCSASKKRKENGV